MIKLSIGCSEEFLRGYSWRRKVCITEQRKLPHPSYSLALLRIGGRNLLAVPYGGTLTLGIRGRMEVAVGTCKNSYIRGRPLSNLSQFKPEGDVSHLLFLTTLTFLEGGRNGY